METTETNPYERAAREHKAATLVAVATRLGYTSRDLAVMGIDGWSALSKLAECRSFPSEETQLLVLDTMRRAEERVEQADPFEGL